MELLSIIVCPKCRQPLESAEGGFALVCGRCGLKYPVAGGVPRLLLEEAVNLRGRGPSAEVRNVKVPRVAFRIIAGPDTGLSFQLEHGACRAIGRGTPDTGRTIVFNVDLALALDEGTKSLVIEYIGRQFGKKGKSPDANLGGFRRAGDVILTDARLSKLHAMVFADSSAVGILDLVSKNGTYVGGIEVESKILKRGDRIELGETVILFEG